MPERTPSSKPATVGPAADPAAALANGKLPALTPDIELELYRRFPPSALLLLSNEQRTLLGAVVRLYYKRSQDFKLDLPPQIITPLREIFRLLGVEDPPQLRGSLLGPNRHGQMYLAQLKQKGLEAPFKVRIHRADGTPAEVTTYSTRAGTFTVRLLDGTDRHMVVNPTNCYIDGKPVCEPIPASVFRKPKKRSDAPPPESSS